MARITQGQKRRQIVYSTPRQAVVFYPYKFKFGPKSKTRPMDTNTIVATDNTLDVSYSKEKGSASGTFSITLDSTKNWKAILRPGEWVTIYMTQTRTLRPLRNTNGLVCLGNIDRVTKQTITNADGSKSIKYQVSGRDFGKIFEKSKFYFNPYVTNDKLAKLFVLSKTGLKITGSPQDFLTTYFDIFYGDGFKRNGDGEKQEKFGEFNQLNIPPAIYKLFGVRNPGEAKLKEIVRIRIGDGKGKVNDNIYGCSTDGKELCPEGFAPYIPFDNVVHNTFWDLINSTADLAINELYTSMEYWEAEDAVFPTITIRKIPFRQNKYTGKSTQGNFKAVYQTLEYVKAFDFSLLTEDLGFSDHERVNYQTLVPNSSFMSKFKDMLSAVLDKASDPTGNLADLFPFVHETDVKRYGLSVMEGTTQFCFGSPEGNPNDKKEQKTEVNKKPLFELISKWQRELIEIWGQMTRFESGTVALKGFYNIDRESGKKIINDHIDVGENFYLIERERLYHIEGFSKSWKAPGHLDMTLTLTRGVAGRPGSKKYHFVDEVEEFNNQDEVASTFTKSNHLR